MPLNHDEAAEQPMDNGPTPPSNYNEVSSRKVKRQRSVSLGGQDSPSDSESDGNEVLSPEGQMSQEAWKENEQRKKAHREWKRHQRQQAREQMRAARKDVEAEIARHREQQLTEKHGTATMTAEDQSRYKSVVDPDTRANTGAPSAMSLSFLV